MNRKIDSDIARKVCGWTWNKTRRRWIDCDGEDTDYGAYFNAERFEPSSSIAHAIEALGRLPIRKIGWRFGRAYNAGKPEFYCTLFVYKNGDCASYGHRTLPQRAICNALLDKRVLAAIAAERKGGRR